MTETSWSRQVDLPPEDRARSPFTGWTRTHWESAADLMLQGVSQFRTPHGAGFDLPGPAGIAGERSDRLEGFARTFLLAAYRIAGARGRGCDKLIGRYTEGLRAGTDPSDKEAWDLPVQGQPVVEAALIAVALYETRPWIWNQLPDETRQRVAAWLSACVGTRPPVSNWLLFPATVQGFLRSVGATTDVAETERALDAVDMLYRGDGWYSDGVPDRYDHYCGWAMHFHTGYWCRMGGDRDDPSRAATYRQRLGRFLRDYRLLFGSDGAPLFHGRSLIYRFAVVAPFWVGVLLDASPIEPGETRRLASGVLKYFLTGGALAGGQLTLGWHSAFPEMAQSYSGAASPYWAAKGIAGLLLPPDHAVWTSTERPLAVEAGDFSSLLRGPELLAWGTASDGIVRVVGRRSRGDDVFYRKLTYTSATSPELGAGDRDAQVAVARDGRVAPRRAARPLEACDWAIASYFPIGQWSLADRWWLPARLTGFFTGWLERRVIGLDPLATRVFRYTETGRVETVSLPIGAAELRIHHVACPVPSRQIDGGLAVAGNRAPTTRVGSCWAEARSADLASVSIGLYGYERATLVESVGSNAFGRYSATPVLHSAAGQSEAILVSIHTVTNHSADAEQIAETIGEVRVDGRRVHVTDQKGREAVVQLVGPEERISLCGDLLPQGVRFARSTREAGVELTWFA